MITVTIVKCLKCKDTIYSRTRHDFRPCSCKSIYIDGGLDYTRVGALKEDIDISKLETSTMKIKATAGDLFYDWNMAEDKYGLIKEK